MFAVLDSIFDKTRVDSNKYDDDIMWVCLVIWELEIVDR